MWHSHVSCDRSRGLEKDDAQSQANGSVDCKLHCVQSQTGQHCGHRGQQERWTVEHEEDACTGLVCLLGLLHPGRAAVLDEMGGCARVCKGGAYDHTMNGEDTLCQVPYLSSS